MSNSLGFNNAFPAILKLPGMVKFIILLTVVLLLTACSSKRPLMPTPDVYALGLQQAFDDDLPAELRTVDANILYATDRTVATRDDGRLDYGLNRAHSLAFGEAIVNIGGDITWETLVVDAGSGKRSQKLNLEIKSVTEIIRGPTDSMIYYEADGSLASTKVGLEKYRSLVATSAGIMRERLATAPRKEVLLYVHGVKNSFDDALYTTAELWHYLGREFVPIAYSWPAGKGGLLRGYNYDRESSEFTVFHFKRFLEWLSGLPEVEGIHIISHSRGTDVVFTSLRELTIRAHARGEIPQERYKVRNVIIAAPDISIDVAIQRTEREGTRWAAERWTTYTSPYDKAIGLAEWLFGGTRFGKTQYDDLDETIKVQIESFSQLDNSDRDAVIQYQGKRGGKAGHNYFRTNPTVASDMVLTVRYGRPPGQKHGRPLDHVNAFFWTIDDNYLESLKKKSAGVEE